LDFELDWSAWLPEGDTITSTEWIVPDGITKGSDTHTTTTATVWLSGGTVNTSYPVTCRITTAQGRTDDRTIRLTIRDR
jgi:hypothetical protein